MNESHVTVCRLCMHHGEGMLPILPGEANYTKLILVFQLKMLRRVGVPSHICCVCLERLDSAHHFKQQILNVGNTLQALYGRVCVCKAKNKLVDSLSREQVDHETGGEIPISFAEINAKSKDVLVSMNLKASDIIHFETGSTTNTNQEVAAIEEVDPIAIDNECLVNSIIKVEDCTTANDSDTSFVYVNVSTKTEMDYVSIVDSIDPLIFKEIPTAKKQRNVGGAKKPRQIEESQFEVTKTKTCHCLICRKSYHSVKLFTSHLQTQHGMDMHGIVKDGSATSTVGPEYRCKFCRAAYNNKNELKFHPCPALKQRRVFFNGHVKCGQCGKLFSALKDLNEHIKKIHMYKCNICDKSFHRENTLASHKHNKHRNKGRSKTVINNEGEKRDEEIVAIAPQLHEVTPSSTSSNTVEPSVKINAEDLAKAPYNQQHVQVTGDLLLNDNHVFVKEEVDLGVETVETLTVPVPNYNDSQINHHQFFETSHTTAINIGGNDLDMWQTVFPYKVEPFIDASTLMEELHESEGSHVEETQSIGDTVQKGNGVKFCSCLICNASFRHFPQFIEHMKNHGIQPTPEEKKRKKEKVPCTVCKKTLNAENYKRHLIRTKCPKTPLTAKQRADRRDRVRRAKQKDAKEAARAVAANKARAVAANKVAAIGKINRRRWRSLHTSRNSVKCTTCSKIFTHAKELETHLRKHKYIDNQEFSCFFCDKVFVFKNRLAIHISKCHYIPANTEVNTSNLLR